MSTEWLSALCQYMKQKSDSSQIWVETMGNVTRYMRERQVFQWDILTQTETQMTIHGYDTLDNQIYNYPLTVDILVPSDWESVIVNQGSRTDTVHAFSGDSINFYVRAHVIPDGGIITLDKMFSILTLSALIEGLYKDTIMVPDTITVELRSSISPYTMVDSRIGVLDSAGVGTFTFTAIKNNVPYYLIIKHRNALETWSSTAHSFNSFTLSYDFTSSQSQAYGNNLILRGGKYCVYSGDVNQDGLVDLSDQIEIDNDNENYVTGFAVTDVNGDGLVDLSDLIPVDNNILNFVTRQVPPGATTTRNIKSHQLPKTVNN
jgi:hypothetical protein